MQRVFFFTNNDYKKTTPHLSDPNFVPLCRINDEKAQKNGTKKTVFWVKKKPRGEDGLVKGETWKTSQQYIGDWKDNMKEGYGIKLYDNKDKYEGYWKNDMRHGKGTYWVCIGKNKYRKLFTGDWFENNKDGQGIYFYKDGSCYDGTWKNSKRDGKGLMIYANGDIYEGAWENDLKHGYGIIEKKKGDKYYGYWDKGLKEGQGYYYYCSTGKIYLGEWHEDAPRCGIFADVDDENLKKEYKKHFQADDAPPSIPIIKLKVPDTILEQSIHNVHFLRNIKAAKNKTFTELFDPDFQADLTKIFTQRNYQITEEDKTDENQNKTPDNVLTVKEFKNICLDKLGQEISDETLELIFYVFGIPLNSETKIDFLLFCRLFHLVYTKNHEENEEENDFINTEENLSQFSQEKIKAMDSQEKKNSIEDENQVIVNYDSQDIEYEA